MSLASDVYDKLKGLCGGRVYPDTSPDTITAPFIVFQSVGGEPVNFTEQAVPDSANARVQIEVWSKTRLEADATMLAVRQAIIQADWPAALVGEPVAEYEPYTKLYGSRADFSVWYSL